MTVVCFSDKSTFTRGVGVFLGYTMRDFLPMGDEAATLTPRWRHFLAQKRILTLSSFFLGIFSEATTPGPSDCGLKGPLFHHMSVASYIPLILLHTPKHYPTRFVRKTSPKGREIYWKSRTGFSTRAHRGRSPCD